jgi:hypothetical protein
MTTPRIKLLEKMLEEERLLKMAQDATVEGDVDQSTADQLADQIFDQLFDETLRDALKDQS